MSSEIPASSESSRPTVQRVLIAGASGFIGTALVEHLRARGCTVVRLVRRQPAGPDELTWKPGPGGLDARPLEGIDAVVNLAGENIGAGRWTNERRTAIRRSRIESTHTLVEAMKRMQRRPAVFVSASAVGVYGDRGDERLTEASATGEGFLPDVCRDWEAEALRAETAGVRVVSTRFGVVLNPHGGALAKLVPVFRAGLGGRIGGGSQWMSWVTLHDAIRAIAFALDEPNVRGAVNVAAPEPVTNREFTQTLARVLRRPAVFPVPAAVLRTIFGEMADATLLASARVLPVRLGEHRFSFRHSELGTAIRYELSRP